MPYLRILNQIYIIILWLIKEIKKMRDELCDNAFPTEERSLVKALVGMRLKS